MDQLQGLLSIIIIHQAIDSFEVVGLSILLIRLGGEWLEKDQVLSIGLDFINYLFEAGPVPHREHLEGSYYLLLIIVALIDGFIPNIVRS